MVLIFNPDSAFFRVEEYPMNWIKTTILMAAITALFMSVGHLLGGQQGMMIALLFALAMNFFSYWFSDQLVLRMYRAQEVDDSIAPQLYRIVHDLAKRAKCLCNWTQSASCRCRCNHRTHAHAHGP